MPNGIIIGDGMVTKLGLKMGATVSLVPVSGTPIDARIAGIFHTGVRQVDETQIYMLTRTAQILAGQIGLINEIRIRLDDAMEARDIAALVESQVRYKALSWQEANEDLMSAFPRAQSHHVHRRRRDFACREFWHLQHRLHHHP